MSMTPKTIAWARVVVDGEGAISSTRAYNCSVGQNGVGDYTLLIGGNGGANSDVCMINVVPETGAAGGAATSRAPLVVHSTDLGKQILFLDDANAAADPAGFWVEVKRYPPLPTP